MEQKYVKCLSNGDGDGDYGSLTIGKRYLVTGEVNNYIYVLDDDNDTCAYPQQLFGELEIGHVVFDAIQEEEEVRHISDAEKELLRRGMCLLDEDAFKALAEAVEERDFDSVKTIVSELEIIAGLLEMFE